MRDAAEDGFVFVGAEYGKDAAVPPRRRSLARRLRGKPVLAFVLLAAIAGCCLAAPALANRDPGQFFLSDLNRPPDGEFYFGTDSLGRDIYSVVWYGGRTSIFIGLASALVGGAIGVAYGSASGCAGASVDAAMMRAAELAQSVPALLTVLLIVSLTGRQNMLTISLAIGVTGWFGLARIVRTEVRQIRNSEYILAARCMGAGFFYLLWRHLVPNFVSAILFAVVSSVGTAMAMESTLSFLGLGLPVEVLSWGSMLSLADRALLTNTWWVVAIPGLFLVVTMLCINSIGSYFRKDVNKRPSNL